jgi:DNA ligase-1
MELSRLVGVVAAVRATSRKTEKTALIAELLRQSEGCETALAALYLTGTLPQGRIGIGWRLVQAARVEGAPAGTPPHLADVDAAFEAAAGESGAGSTERKVRALRGLMGRADEGGRRFLVELLMGEVRQGALDGLVQDAIARAASLPPADVRQAAMFADHLGEVAQAALHAGAAGLARFSLRLLSPVAPMLASTAEDVGEALGRLGEAAFEYKVDGARIQVHKAGDEVRIFTRQLQDVTDRLPEIVAWARALGPRELVVEGEAVALRPDGRPQPFQVTMRRIGRRKDVAAAQQSQPLSSFFFDCLFVEGEGSLLTLPYAARAERLAATVGPGSLLPRLVTGREDEAQRFLDQALAAGHEGVMAKSLEAPYGAGHRGFHWLKLKPAHTLDLLVLAVEWGSGRRKGWLSNLHLGAIDPRSGQPVMLGKTFKGLTDAMLRWQTEKLLSLETGRDQWTVYVRPELVVEVAFGEVQESSRYPAGLALRFARVKRYREDKPPSAADTIDTVRALFDAQRA